MARRTQKTNPPEDGSSAGSPTAVSHTQTGAHRSAAYDIKADGAQLADLAHLPQWVAWRQEIKNGEVKKIPKNPATGGNARVPTDPKTYGSRDAAEQRWINLPKKRNAVGGIGIVLGPLPMVGMSLLITNKQKAQLADLNYSADAISTMTPEHAHLILRTYGLLIDGEYLVGIDLDSCLDEQGNIADWAQSVIDRFGTYAEVSPSGTGVKLFFMMASEEHAKLHALLGRGPDGIQLLRKTFAAGEHREVAIDTARFYAITGQRLDDRPLRMVAFKDVEWFVTVAGPGYLKQQKSGNGHANGNGHVHPSYKQVLGHFLGKKDLDDSRSGHACRFMRDRRAEGMDYQQARAAILVLTNDDIVGEWAHEVDERQLYRAYHYWDPKFNDGFDEQPEQHEEQFKFKLIPFRELRPSAERNYAVKGLFPRVGLVVVWGPPKCFKSFWTMDVSLHVALGWEYRGRRIQQGSVVYCAFEGAAGFKARAEGFRIAHNIPAEQDVPFYLSPAHMSLIKDHKALIKCIQGQVGDNPIMVVLDTLNRSLEGSESKDEDMAAYLSAADAIREVFGCVVVIVHHCGINAERPRGHTSLTGAVDTQLKVERHKDTNSASVEVELMKDGPEGDVIESDFERVVVAIDEDGDEMSSLVAKPSKMTVSKVEAKLDGKAALALRMLKEVITDGGVVKKDTGFPDHPVAPLDAWRDYCYGAGISEANGESSKRAAMKRARDKLLFNKPPLIRVWNGYAWPVEPEFGDMEN